MEHIKNYVPPMILRESGLFLETPILDGSLVDKAVITSMGQDVEPHDFGSDDFNHTWE